MSPQTPSRRTQAYRLLRNECGFTHHQARHLIMRHMPHLGEFRQVFYSGLKADKEAWLEASIPIALLSLREDPRAAGQSILKYCWPNRGSSGEGPELPYTCARLAGEFVSVELGFDPTQKRVLWAQIERLLRREEREAEAAWIDRMIATYLKVRKVL